MKELDFEVVYAQHSELVRRALTRRGIRPADLDDVTQEAFVVIHRLLPTFEQRASLETWLHAVAWRVASGHHKRRRASMAPADASVTVNELSPAELPGVELLHASLARMPHDDRDLFALHEVGGLSVAELSELTGSARATISDRLERIRRTLGRMLSTPPTSRADTLPNEADSESFAAQRELARDYVELPSFDEEHPDYCFSTLGDTVLARWRGDTSDEAMARIAEIMVTMGNASPGGITFLSMIEAAAGPPQRRGRQMMLELAADMRGKMRAAAWFIGAQGLGYLVVPVVNSTVFLTRTSFNIRFFRELPAATEWLAPHTDGRTSQELLQRCAEMSARLDRCRK